MTGSRLRLGWLFAGVCVLAACDAAPSRGGPRALPLVEVMPVAEATIAPELALVGVLTAEQSLTLMPEVAGRVVRLAVQDGQAVQAGQLLVQLDDRAVQAQRMQAEAQRTLARAERARAEALFAQDLLPRNELDRLRAAEAVAEAEVGRWLAEVDLYRVRAPFAGRVGLRQVVAGERVQAGQALMTLADADPLLLDVSVAEHEAALLSVGQAATITVPVLGEDALTGRVTALEPQLTVRSRALNVRLALQNPEGRLQPGMSARARVQLSAPVTGLWLPDHAVVARDGQQVVYRVDPAAEPQTVTAVAVTLGQRRAGQTEITAGLTAGDLVVVSGLNKLNAPSVPVRTQPLARTPDAS